MNESTRVFVALAAAAALGTLVGAVESEPPLRAADALAPIGTLWVNAIRMTVIPLVVSLLVTGVASAADVRTIGRLGGRTLLVFGSLLMGAALVAIPLAKALFGLLPPHGGATPALPAGAAEAAGQLTAGEAQTLATWLVSLIPTNPVAAAASGSMVPLILFTLILALAVARGSARTRTTLVEFFTALGDAMLLVVRWVILAAPVGVFALVLPLAAHAGAAFVGSVGFYIVAYTVTTLTVILLLYPVVAIGARIPMRRFARAAIEPQLIGMSCSSSIASLPAMVVSAEQGLALSPRVTGFVLPLAVSAFKLAAPVSWTVGALFVGWFYGIPLGARDLGIIAFAAVFLSFAAPGVPRGAFIMLTPLFLAIGLPPEGIGILIAVDALPDVVATVLNVTGDLTAAALVARGDQPQSSAMGGAAPVVVGHGTQAVP
jgi:Na+/H+-dicarboxylate symporter